MAAAAYGLCVATALACAVLLTRAYMASRVRLLFWSALCFWGLSITNAIAMIDTFVVPERDLFLLRCATGLGSVLVLLFGMVWESR